MGKVFLAIGAGLALADASIVTLGLPSMLVELNATVEGVALVLGVYTAVLAVSVPLAARLSGRIGAPKLCAAGMGLFGLASLACGLSGSLQLLLVLRAIQAVGGAAALIGAFELLDGGEPGAGRRLWVAASVFGTATGPALGGALTEAFDWRAIFLAQTPLIAPGALVALRIARDGLVARTDPGNEPPPAQPAAPSPPAAGPFVAPEARQTRGPLLGLVALALMSAALTAVVFLVVLLLVAGWSVDPLVAALAVSVLPIAAVAASRIPGDPLSRSACGALLIAGGIGCLALIPAASAWWTVTPQILAGAGMGMALPALAGELLPERTRADAARLLSIRHIGIAIALAVLAPIVSSTLDDTIESAREQGAAAVLDAPLDPREKIGLAPALFAGVDTDDPRGQLQRAVADVRQDVDGEEEVLVSDLGDRLDEVITAAVRDAFRIAFIVTGGLALIAALALIWSALELGRGLRRGAIGLCAVASVASGAGYGLAFAHAEREQIKILDPCHADRNLPDTGGIGGFLQDQTLQALDRAACEFDASREELLLALFDDELRDRFKEDHGVDPGSITDLGPAALGL